MSYSEVLILAVTRMRGGVCVAGMTAEHNTASGLRWVRPVKNSGGLLVGDIRYQGGALMRIGDVVGWHLGAARPDPPHVEDMLVDPVRHRPELLRHHDTTDRARFCAGHLDRTPDDMLVHRRRSLALVRPDTVHAIWQRDPYSGHYEARLAFKTHGFSTDLRGIPATDLAWRALGRCWLGNSESLELDDAALRNRLGELFLVVGLGREFKGRNWPLVVGVHAPGMPAVTIDEYAL
jgi:hypothetical protein